MQLNRVDNELVVGRPLRVVFTYFSRLENMSEWAGVKEIRRETPGRLKTGTVYLSVGKLGPKQVSTRITFTDYQADKQFATRSQMGPFSFSDRFLFEPVPGGTVISQATRVRARGIYRLFVPVVTFLTRGRLRASLYAAAELLENDSGAK